MSRRRLSHMRNFSDPDYLEPVHKTNKTLAQQNLLNQIRVGLPCDLPDSKIIIRLKRWESNYTEYSRDAYGQKPSCCKASGS